MTTITHDGRITKKLFSTRQMVTLSLLSALSYVLMLLESPPFLGFLRLEFSDIPAIFAGFQFGPGAGVIVELIKNLIKAVTASKTGGIGELANFVVSIAFIIPACLIFRKMKSKYKTVLAFLAATLAMTVVGGIVNYFVTVPLFASLFGGMENILGVASGTIPAIRDLKTLILIGITPFNIVKGILMSITGYLVYRMAHRML